MINLTKAPFFLVKEDIEWVENTKKAMTLEEKIGQLFVPIGYSGDADYLEHVMLSHHIGGIMNRTVMVSFTLVARTNCWLLLRFPILLKQHPPKR